LKCLKKFKLHKAGRIQIPTPLVVITTLVVPATYIATLYFTAVMPRITTIYIVVRQLSGLSLLRKIVVISTGYEESDPIIAIF